ncbi:hypothetical protein [Mycobacterium hubeiense]|uniref:hypothetical protein n=1 Tax=Mycobacterium hubeiense TaxID=1867256 RepID=UPI000C7F47ED|nr:hypothetical protein [Mycobacterium sp. QGD 101]
MVMPLIQAKVADLGSGNLYQVRERALHAISEAEQNEFLVAENLTVTDTRRYTAREMNHYLERKAQAEEHHADITKWASILASEDTQVGSKLQASAAALAGNDPPGPER